MCVRQSLSRVRILGDPMDCSPQGSSVHGILQARILEWVAMPSSRRSSQPRDRTWVSYIAGRFFTVREGVVMPKESPICYILSVFDHLRSGRYS